MSEPTSKIGLVANLFSRMMYFAAKGDVESGHKHPFDHLTLLANGGLKVRVLGEETVFTAPAMIYIRADLEHELEATEGGTVAYCIHALREGNKSGDIIDPSMVPQGVKLSALVASKIVDDVVNPEQAFTRPISGLVPVTRL